MVTPNALLIARCFNFLFILCVSYYGLIANYYYFELYFEYIQVVIMWHVRIKIMPLYYLQESVCGWEGVEERLINVRTILFIGEQPDCVWVPTIEL